MSDEALASTLAAMDASTLWGDLLRSLRDCHDGLEAYVKEKPNLNESYEEALRLLEKDNVEAAIDLLHRDLLASPRAAQTLYLFGMSHVLAGNTTFGLDCVQQAYSIKPWIRDDLATIPGAIDKLPTLKPEDPRAREWVEYMLLRLYPLSFGLGYHAIINTMLRDAPVLSFVEVGANDGKSADPLFKYVLDGHLKGLLIEPMPDPFARLQKTYEGTEGNTFLNLGVGRTDGEIELYHSERSTLTTANPEKNALKDRADLKKATVPVKSLANILDEHAMKSFDILQIDTEGYEWEILEEFPLKNYDISVIFIEFYCLSIKERIGMFQKLLDAEYSYYFDGTNLLAAKPEKFPSLTFGHREGDFAIASSEKQA